VSQSLFCSTEPTLEASHSEQPGSHFNFASSKDRSIDFRSLSVGKSNMQLYCTYLVESCDMNISSESNLIEAPTQKGTLSQNLSVSAMQTV
jgi:site-specific recombinase XerC